MKTNVKVKEFIQKRAETEQEGKVKYNIKNVHVAVKNEDAAGEVTYEIPFKMRGAVSISLEAQGELTPFYADGIKFYTSSSNAGYEGDLEMAYITDEFREKILKELKDANGVMFETTNAESTEFALLFEIDGDKRSTRFVFFNCSSTRPTVESKTVEDKKEPGTEKVKISCASSEDGIVRAKTTKDVAEATYKEWYKAVYVTPVTGETK